MRIIKQLVLLSGVVSLSLGLGAQNSSQEGAMQLSLEQAQQIALEHNYTLQNASLDVRKAELARWESIASLMPTVAASFDYQNMCGYKMEFMQGISIPMNPSGSLGITTSLGYNGAQFVALVMSRISQEMADQTLQQNERTLGSQVKNIYTSILVMERTVALLDSNLANMEQLERSTQETVRVGAAEQTDADKLSVQVATLRNSINSARRSLQMLYNSLSLQLGVPFDGKVELTTPLNQLVSIDDAGALVSENFDINRNYNYQLLKKSEELSQQQIMMAWMNYSPTVAIFHQYSSKTYFGKEAGMNMTPPNMVGVQLSWNIFQSGSRMAKVREAKIDHEKTLNSQQQAVDALKVQHKQLCYNLVTALDDYRIQDANLEVSQRVFNNTAEKYKYGRASSLEVTNASTELLSAQSNYIQAVMSVIQAQIELEELLNK